MPPVQEASATVWAGDRAAGHAASRAWSGWREPPSMKFWLIGCTSLRIWYYPHLSLRHTHHFLSVSLSLSLSLSLSHSVCLCWLTKVHVCVRAHACDVPLTAFMCACGDAACECDFCRYPA
ncbi:hypothetical protein VPH35_134711 [Triticum aestivum]